MTILNLTEKMQRDFYKFKENVIRSLIPKDQDPIEYLTLHKCEIYTFPHESCEIIVIDGIQIGKFDCTIEHTANNGLQITWHWTPYE